MNELIQIKIVNPGEKAEETERIKQALSADLVRIQRGNNLEVPTAKVLIGTNAGTETQSIQPSAILTIYGKRLATRNKIAKVLKTIGIEIIQIGEKISW